ncbi:MAG: ribosomal protein S18-alanine N-acetyltransferase [Anaerolineaceae bacterium]|nr:ribosomal protein S18-alanine N-acetyltransferase [Anaerolineaceae bacterium]
MSLHLRYMSAADVKPVVAIDHQAFDLPWTPESYLYEVRESTHTYMVVLDFEQEQAPLLPWWRRLLGLHNGHHAHHDIAGYGGLWKIQSEAHISTIATHPDYRGRGWGEILLASMVRRAIFLEASYVILEVRVSNTVAQNLYTKYGFVTRRVVEKYYRNNNEDAYEMELLLTPQAIEEFEARFAALLARHPFVDDYTTTPHPRSQRYLA